ncbi:MAG: glutathione ABC transporter permease GsiC, partial [Candidatus Bipolaricaulia bacterium]
MARYLARRLAFCAVLLLVISWAAFFVMHLAPGDPLAMYVDPEKGFLTPDEKEILRHNLGLDRPLVV